MNVSNITTPGHGNVRVLIGSRYTGRPAAHADTTTGTYWEALPRIEGHALQLQACLLAPAPRRKAAGKLRAAIAARLRRQALCPTTGVMRGAR